MESKKFAFLLVATVVVILGTVAPPVTAARNELMPWTIVTDGNIRNPFANIFWVDNIPAENCYKKGSYTINCSDCCSKRCATIQTPYPICA
ncbi:hypothetical protein V6N13_113462 [Hibiscus sabdariffa]